MRVCMCVPAKLSHGVRVPVNLPHGVRSWLTLGLSLASPCRRPLMLRTTQRTVARMPLLVLVLVLVQALVLVQPQATALWHKTATRPATATSTARPPV